MLYPKTPDMFGLVFVDGQEDGDAYDWQQTDVWVDPVTNEYFIYSDGGCSCNGTYEEVYTRADLDGPMTIHGVLNSVSIELADRLLTRGL